MTTAPHTPADAAEHTPADTAALIGSHAPTPEQAEVMSHPTAPQLVVAGAGSGKTETMSLRVVHLVHNGLVRPDEVLGLTFTRKAAGELGERLRTRLRTLTRALGGRRPDPRGELETAWPEVSTYDSFAAAIYKDHALRLGLDPAARLVTAAESYELAHALVSGWAGPLDAADGPALSTLVDAVVDLDAATMSLLASTVTPDLLRAELEETSLNLLDAPVSGKKRGPSADVRKIATSHRARVELLAMVEALRAERRAKGVATFADIADAARRIVTGFPDVRDELRARYRLVLLDEYQDTSVAQTDLLAAAFGDGWPVTAVGDPHQSIYGWRGASAAALEEFPERFGGPEPAPVRRLSTSWRNDHAILDVANAVSRPLQAGSTLPLHTLGARPGAAPGTVVGAWFATDREEADAIALELEHRWHAPFLAAEAAEPGSGRTAAVLTRTNAQLEVLQDALRRRGVPSQIVGVGGLIVRPEILDVRAALAVAVDPSRGDRLVRLVTGLGLGLADLRTLWSWAGDLARLGIGAGTAAGRAAASDLDLAIDAEESAIDPRQEQALAEAVDHLPGKDWTAHGHALTGAARDRLTHLSRALRRIQSAVHLPVHDAVGVAIEALGLDLEVVAAATDSPAAARAGLDELVRLAGGYATGVDGATLSGFLSYLDRAEEKERGLADAEASPEQGEEAADPLRGVVQLMTMHRAKGLEWDVVAIPGLSLGTLPKIYVSPKLEHPADFVPKDSAWLTDLGTVPAAVRGDAARLPQLELAEVADQHGVDDAIEAFKQAAGRHAVVEERRLAYVAVTRARSELILTWSSFTKETSTARFRSPFLDEAIATGVVEPLPERVLDRPADAPEENPQVGLVTEGQWPPLPADEGPAVRAARAAADAVRAAAEGPLDLDTSAEASPWDRAAAMLLAERDELLARRGEVPLGDHLAATGLVALADDPEWFARQLIRPVPRAPRREADLGTRFHEWVEQRFEAETLPGFLHMTEDEERGAPGSDPGPGETGGREAAGGPAPGDEARLRELQEAFEASEWGSRRPSAVEEAAEVRVGPLVLRCRIDAVYDNPDGSVEIVDWKTGRLPRPEEREARLLQLDVNRLAWSRAKGIPIEQVRAHLYYVMHAESVPARTDGEAAVEARVLAALERGTAVGG
ncbi:MAG: UvrD-helicase domain-containing protein [Actinomycetaceae bacterium]